MSAAQSAIFDVIQEIQVGTSRMFGEFRQALPGMEYAVLCAALDLLVSTGDLNAFGPAHDRYSIIYSRTR